MADQDSHTKRPKQRSSTSPPRKRQFTLPLPVPKSTKPSYTASTSRYDSSKSGGDRDLREHQRPSRSNWNNSKAQSSLSPQRQQNNSSSDHHQNDKDRERQRYNRFVIGRLLINMKKHKDSWPLERPWLAAPDYFNIIRQKPIDLGKIQANFYRSEYSCNSEVLQDIKQVFENCFTYYKEDTEEFQCAIRLHKYFKQEAKNLGLVDKEEELETEIMKKLAAKEKRSNQLSDHDLFLKQQQKEIQQKIELNQQ